jgi:hypothetical protein
MGWTTGVRFPVEVRVFCSLTLPDRLWSQPDTYPVRIGTSSWETMRTEREAGDLQLSSAERDIHVSYTS